MTPVTPTTLSPTYAANFGPTQTTVYSGALPLSSAVTGPAGGPKDFDIVINLQTPFFYNPAQGNLLIEVKNFVGVRTVQFDAVSSVAVTNRVYNEDNNPNGAVGILNPGLVAGLVTQFIFGNVLDGTYQLRYFANLDKGDSYVNLSNAGTLAGFAPAGNICVNVYTFDPAEELISCCACPITPNGLVSLSARNDLISNTLTPGVPTSVTVKLVSSAVFSSAAGNPNISAATACNASTINAPGSNPATPVGNVLARGMRAWATTLHLNTSLLPAPGLYQETETPFSIAELSASELTKLTSFCGFIQANGSGFGICKACRFGALGAGQK